MNHNFDWYNVFGGPFCSICGCSYEGETCLQKGQYYVVKIFVEENYWVNSLKSYKTIKEACELAIGLNSLGYETVVELIKEKDDNIFDWSKEGF